MGGRGPLEWSLPSPGLWRLHSALTLPWPGQLVTQKKNLLFQSTIEVLVRLIMWNKVLLSFSKVGVWGHMIAAPTSRVLSTLASGHRGICPWELEVMRPVSR